VGSYGVIAKTSEVLIELLRHRITERSDVIDLDRNKIALTSPNAIGEDADVRLSLYLYTIDKNAVMNNNYKEYDIETETLDTPPIALDLCYLMTAYPAGTGGNEELSPETIDQHRIFGLGVQTMNDVGIIEGDELGHTKFDTDVSITLQPDTTRDAHEIWFNAIGDHPYHLSAAYVVGPILIDSTQEEYEPAVRSRDLGFSDIREERARQERRQPDQAQTD